MRRILALLTCAAIALSAFGSIAGAEGTTVTTSVADLSLTLAPEGTATGVIGVIAPAGATVSVSSDSDWLTVEPASLTGSVTVTVTASGKGKAPGEVLMGTVTVNGGSAGTVVIPVVATVATPGNGPMMSAVPARLDLNTLEPNKASIQRLTLEFAIPMSGVVSADGAWMEITPKTFTNVTRQAVIIKVSTNNLILGQVYSGNVEVRSGSYPTLAVPVIFRVGDP